MEIRTESSFQNDKTKVSQGYELYSSVEVREKLTQCVQPIHRIAPSYVSSLLEGDPGHEYHALALFHSIYMSVL